MLTLAIEPLNTQDAIPAPEPRAAASSAVEKARSATSLTAHEEQVGHSRQSRMSYQLIHVQNTKLQAELTAVREQLLKAQEHAEDLSRDLEAVKESNDEQRNHQIKVDELVRHSKELEAANARFTEAEQQLEALSHSSNLQLELVKKTSAVRTMCLFFTAFMLPKILRAIFGGTFVKAR